MYVNQVYNVVYNTLYVAGIVNANNCTTQNWIFAMYIYHGKHAFLCKTMYLPFDNKRLNSKCWELEEWLILSQYANVIFLCDLFLWFTSASE